MNILKPSDIKMGHVYYDFLNDRVIYTSYVDWIMSNEYIRVVYLEKEFSNPSTVIIPVGGYVTWEEMGDL